jgi:hypothetical protein
MPRCLPLLLSCCAAATLLACGSIPAGAATAFDGTWSVLVVTERGDCDRAYRYPVRVQNGAVSYAGDASFAVSGRVARNGSVQVQIGRGDSSARGSGRLSRDAGRGTWTGRSSSGSCSGTWSAERR